MSIVTSLPPEGLSVTPTPRGFVDSVFGVRSATFGFVLRLNSSRFVQPSWSGSLSAVRERLLNFNISHASLIRRYRVYRQRALRLAYPSGSAPR